MIVTGYLYVSETGSIRTTKRKGEIKDNEIAVELKMHVPDSYFARPLPVLETWLPALASGEPAPERIEQIVDISAQSIAKRLRLDVDTVRDGLIEMLDAQQASDQT